jgi:uroporphyrin-III C-methyltransferase / precorrin-2 dehydrogenase / sirohydrochlorin ferrochelatase
MNDLYPVFLKMQHQPILIVGGGRVAEQKINSLLETKSDITVIAPEISPAIMKLVEEERIHLRQREFRDGDVGGFFIVIGATDDRKTQERIYSEARSKGIQVNIVDVPELCTFYLSSVFQKGDLKIAVSTNGKSPTLGKIIRNKIRNEFSNGYPELLERLGEIRPDVQNTFPDFESRKKLHEKIVRSELERLDDNRRCQRQGARNQNRETTGYGRVYLVGAGPGDTELITVKGLKILQQAEVVLYDALINKELLDEASEAAEKIFVGKRAGEYCLKQEEINNLLILKAREGKRVVRLKGGDPFIFGRGGEELEALRKERIDVEIVPGVTAGVGVPASLGIPLTNRGESSSVVFLTGHKDGAHTGEDADWKNLSHADTAVIYMGTKKLGELAEKLTNNGIPASRPVAVVFGGTLPEQEIIVATLETIEMSVGDVPRKLPGLIIVGEVVRRYERRKSNLVSQFSAAFMSEAVNTEIF